MVDTGHTMALERGRLRQILKLRQRPLLRLTEYTEDMEATVVDTVEVIGDMDIEDLARGRQKLKLRQKPLQRLTEDLEDMEATVVDTVEVIGDMDIEDLARGRQKLNLTLGMDTTTVMEALQDME